MRRLAFLAVLFPLAAFAQSAIPEPDAAGLVTTFLAALAAKNYALLGSVAVLALVWLARKFGSLVIPALGTPRGGAVLSALGGTAGLLVAALGAGQAFSVSLVVGCFWTALGASGLWSVGKNLATPAKKSVPDVTPQAQPQVPVCSAADIANGKPGCV